MKVEVSRTERLFDGFLKLDQVYLRHETPQGQMTPEMMRLNVEHGDGAAVLLLNRDSNTIVMTRQFRYAHWQRGDGGWILEIPAGVVAEGCDPEQVAKAELVEEVGYQASQLQFVQQFYASPGTSTERVFVYFAQVSAADRVNRGGGRADEHEYIQVIELPIEQVLDMLDRGEIIDGKTVIALQWYARHHLQK